MNKKLPRYSQRLDIKDPEWHERACGVVALKTLLDYWDPSHSHEFDELIASGIRADAYIEGVGWKHRELAELANHCGLYGESFDWFADTPNVAFEKLKEHLNNYPVLCSIHKDLEPNGSGHLVVVYKIEDGRVYYLDPDSKTREGINRGALLEQFLNGWKRRIIVIRPEE